MWQIAVEQPLRHLRRVVLLAVLLAGAVPASAHSAPSAQVAGFSAGLCNVFLYASAPAVGQAAANAFASCIGTTPRVLILQLTPGPTPQKSTTPYASQLYLSDTVKIAGGKSLTACALLTTPAGARIGGICTTVQRPIVGGAI